VPVPSITLDKGFFSFVYYSQNLHKRKVESVSFRQESFRYRFLMAIFEA